MNSSFLGYCQENLHLIKFLNIKNAQNWIGERTLSCDCRENFKLTLDEESCQTKWTYFCRDDFIAGVGDSLVIQAEWVKTFYNSFVGENYRKSNGDDISLIAEVPVVCEMTYKENVARKGFLLSAERSRVLADSRQSYAMSIAQSWLALIVLSVLTLFFIKQCSRKGRLLKKRFEKYEDNGKDIDVYLVGSVRDTVIIDQLKSDLEKFNFTVETTTDNLLPNPNEVNDDFASKAPRIKALVHLFSPGILKKVKTGFANQKEHTWFNSWFDQGMSSLRKVCNDNKMKKICITVFAEFEGGKSKPNEIENQIKTKIETELEKVNKSEVVIPIVELSKSFKQCLPEKNGRGPYETDRDYQATVDRLRYHLPVPRPTKVAKQSNQEEEKMELVEK